MTELERIQTILKENGIQAKKSFGQNFLINEGIIKRIISGMDLDSFDCVFEIGPGLGSLTIPLSEKVKRIIAVDSDRDMVAILKDIFQDSKKVTVVESDFLRFNPENYALVKTSAFIGNLPYNITSKLIEYLLKNDAERAGFMVQKEVADKLTYIPNKKDNSALGCFIKARGEINQIASVERSCFLPSPKVDSAFLRFDKKRDVPFSLYPLFKAFFKDPNKTINNCLRQDEKYKRAIEKLKDEPLLNKRARQVEASQLKELSERITALL